MRKRYRELLALPECKNYWRLRSSFFTFLASFFSFGVFAGSFFTDFFVSLLLLMVDAPFGKG